MLFDTHGRQIDFCGAAPHPEGLSIYRGAHRDAVGTEPGFRGGSATQPLFAKVPEALLSQQAIFRALTSLASLMFN